MVAVRGSIAALIAMQLSLTGCSTQQIARFEANVGSMRCTKDGGLTEGTPDHQRCVAAYAAAAERERTETQAALLGVAGASTQVWSAEQQGRAQAAANAAQPQQRTPVRSTAPQQHALVSQQTDLNWNRTCRYADGTVIAVGQNQCPPSIAGQY
jgi:hypothetical protein